MLSENMKTYGYDLPTTLAWYNRWPGNINSICPKTSKGRTLSWETFEKLPKETKDYVKKICNNILKLNWEQEIENIEQLLSSVLGIEPPEIKRSNDSILVWPEILATKRNEFWWIGNSIMTWFQWYYQKTAFEKMNGVEWKTTRTHPDVKKYLDRWLSYEDSVEKYIDKKVKTSKVKSFVLYFWANTKEVDQTIQDLTVWCEILEKKWIQPILSTCIWANNHDRLDELNPKIKELGDEKYPVLDFASQESLITMWDNKHPTGTWYKTMENLILAA
jgi:hypothetical protein